MDLNWLESLLYGLVSGFTEFMPVSAQAHKALLLSLFGQAREHALMGLCIHIGVVLALFFTSRSLFARLSREYAMLKIPKHRRKRPLDMQAILDVSFARTAGITLLIGFLLYFKTVKWRFSLPVVALGLLINGVLLHIPMYLPWGNKDSQNMSRLDAVLFGLAAAASVIPGISRIGAGVSAASARGADPQQAFKWGLLISIPALICLIIFDVYHIAVGGLSGIGFLFVLQCLICGGMAYLGAFGAITLMRIVTRRSGLYNYSYYCWGAALFVFILYLT